MIEELQRLRRRARASARMATGLRRSDRRKAATAGAPLARTARRWKGGDPVRNDAARLF